MKTSIYAALAFTVSLSALLGSATHAATLANATYDTDSYVFIGTNNEFETGISSFADETGGVLKSLALGHFNFGVIKFDDLSGIDTVANGGPNKFLTLETMQAGSAVVGVSVAADDVQNGYPSASGSFNGPASGTGDERLQWYFDNIKGDDAAYGGYAGGAEHVGVLSLSGASTYSLDVSAVVDVWIDGSTPNHGFGIWSESTTAGQGSPLDFASSENPILGNPFNGPLLTSTSIPEPTACGLLALGLFVSSLARSRS